MSDRATLKYVGPDQHVRVGSETFIRDKETLVTDPEVIAEARARDDFRDESPAHWLDEPKAAEAAMPAPAKPKPARVRKPKAKGKA